MSRQIQVNGVNFHNSMSTLNIIAVREDGSVIDQRTYESCCHSYEELYAKYARKAIRFFRFTYGIKELRQAPLRKGVAA